MLVVKVLQPGRISGVPSLSISCQHLGNNLYITFLRDGSLARVITFLFDASERVRFSEGLIIKHGLN